MATTTYMINIYATIIKNYPYLVAFLFGIIPALIWLWFWLKEDTHPEPAKMITLSFVGGMLAVIIVLPIQKYIYHIIQDRNWLAFSLWATVEELTKFIIVYAIALCHKVTDEPVDNIIYLIVSALGFVALENALFIIEPLKHGDVIASVVTSNLRFVGASLLHTISSATVGICMALAFYKSRQAKLLYTFLGLFLASALHTAFNLFIINNTEGNVFLTFGFVWIGIIALLVLFEKVKHIIPNKL